MIEKSIVKGLVEEWLEGRDYFLVDVSVSADDRIVVEIDHAEGAVRKRTMNLKWAVPVSDSRSRSCSNT